MLTVGSLFSGIGGFDLGFERAWFQLTWQCEIDPFCRSVLASHWPDVARFDDVRTVADLPPVDVLTAGFPCQDVSVAGQRVGLSGARTGLFFELMRVIRELQPSFVVLENVPGLLTSARGFDFAVVLHQLDQCGYVGAWRVLDSQYFGLAQRRQRVFLVAGLGRLGDIAQTVLFESACGEGDSAAGDEAGTRVAATLRGRAHNAGSHAPRRGGEDDFNLVIQDARGHDKRQNGLGVSGCGLMYTLDGASEHAVAFNWQTGQSQEQFSADISPSLSVGQTPAVYGVHANQRGELRTSPLAGSLNANRSATQYEGIFSTLNCGGNQGGFRTEPSQHLIVDGERARALVGSMFKRHDDDTDTLIPLLARPLKSGGNDRQDESHETYIASPITASGGHHGHSSARGDGRDNLVATLVSGENRTGGTRRPGSSADTAATQLQSSPMGVRRLTPLECERLQGFPDGWTCLCGKGHRGRQFCRCSDSARYRGLGNAVSVPVAEWIARQILIAEDP